MLNLKNNIFSNNLINFILLILIFIFSNVAHAQTINAWQALPLIDHHNQPVKISDAAGKYALVNFTFIDCVMYCTVQTQQLLKLRDRLARTFSEEYFEVFSISLTPERDTYKGMHGFATRFSAQDFNNWHFATGSIENVEKIMNALEVKIAKGKEAGQINHSTFVYLIDPQGNLLKTFQGVPLDDDAIYSTLTKKLN